MTDEELDALVEYLRGKAFISQREADAITTLRAQLAEAKKERNAVVATLVEVSRWWAKEEARADRAEQRVATLEHEVRLREAALAALIEVGKTE